MLVRSFNTARARPAHAPLASRTRGLGVAESGPRRMARAQERARDIIIMANGRGVGAENKQQ